MLALDWRQARAIRVSGGTVPDAFAAIVMPPEQDRARAYNLARLKIGAVARLVDLIGLLFALFAGFDLASRIAGSLAAPGLVRSLLIVGLICGAQFLMSLPFSVWRTFGPEQRFGFNRATPMRFMRDTLTGAVLTVALGVPILAILLTMMPDPMSGSTSGLGRWWWIAAWLILGAVSLGAPFLYLRLVLPLFNTLSPLREPVAAPVRALLDRTGFRTGSLLEMDASRRSRRSNAFVTGWGAAKRIVLFDTLIDAHPPEEIEAVVAHELGHAHHRHIIGQSLRMLVLSFVFCAAIGWLSGQTWLQPAFGIAHPDPALGLILALLLTQLVSPFLSVAGNVLSRRHEYEADAFAGRMVGQRPMISALVRLSQANAATVIPDRLYSTVHHTHPPVPFRIAALERAAG